MNDVASQTTVFVHDCMPGKNIKSVFFLVARREELDRAGFSTNSPPSPSHFLPYFPMFLCDYPRLRFLDSVFSSLLFLLSSPLFLPYARMFSGITVLCVYIREQEQEIFCSKQQREEVSSSNKVRFFSSDNEFM